MEVQQLQKYYDNCKRKIRALEKFWQSFFMVDRKPWDCIEWVWHLASKMSRIEKECLIVACQSWSLQVETALSDRIWLTLNSWHSNARSINSRRLGQG